ncbi:MAG: DUF935 family protein [Polyangiaceae bacterium]
MSRRTRKNQHRAPLAAQSSGAKVRPFQQGSPRAPSVGAARLEPDSHTVSQWSPDLICSAEAQALTGAFRLAADLCEEMMSDDRLSGVLTKLGLILRLPLQFEPPGQGKPDGDEVSQALSETDWWRILPEDKASELLAWARLFGVALAHISDYAKDPDSGRLVPVVDVWSPKHLRRRDGQWEAETEAGRWEAITPGDGRWIVWTPYGAKRPTHRAPWRALSRWWLLKQYARNDWGKHSHRHGMGVFAAVPGENLGTTEAQRGQIAQELKNLYGSSGIALPEGWDLKLVESTARTFESFVKQCELADRAMAVAILGQNLSTEVQSGSLAAATAHATIEAGVIGLIAESLSTLAREQLLTWYVEFNWGDRSRAPWPKWDTRPPKDSAARAEVLVKLGQSLPALKNAGLRLPLATLIEEFGFEFEEVEEPEPPPPPVVPPPGDPEDPNAPADPEEADPEEPVEPGKNEPAAEPGAFYRLASGGHIRAESGFVQGQLYADAVAERAQHHFADALRDSLLGPVMRALGQAEDYDDFRERLLDAYDDADPEVLSQIVEGALKLGQLGGMAAVIQDTPELRRPES